VSRICRVRVPQPTFEEHPGRLRVIRGGNGFGDHRVGFVDGTFDAGGDHRFAGEPPAVLDAHIGGEDDGIGGGDGRRGQGSAARGTLGLHHDIDIGAFGGQFQRIGRHVGVRDSGGAGRDRDDSLLGSRRRDGRGCRIDYSLHQRDQVTGRGCRAQRCDELLAHQSAGQAGQQLHVLGAAGIRCGDEEHQIGRPVRGAEVDLGS
jgi:hypothetical protein